MIGVGALGRHHARVWAGHRGARLVGVYDSDARSRGRGRRAARLPGVSRRRLAARRRRTPSRSRCPTVAHHAVARAALERGRDVLVEKPITATLARGRRPGGAGRRARARAAGRATSSASTRRRPCCSRPAAGARFVEVHRLGSFSAAQPGRRRGARPHDPRPRHRAGARRLASRCRSTPSACPCSRRKVDIANARLRFASGLIANLTASRVSVEKVRKFRVFAPAHVRLGRLRGTRGTGLPAGGRRAGPPPHRAPSARGARRGAAPPADRVLRGRRADAARRRSSRARTAGGPWPSRTRSWTGWPRPDGHTSALTVRHIT